MRLRAGLDLIIGPAVTSVYVGDVIGLYEEVIERGVEGHFLLGCSIDYYPRKIAVPGSSGRRPIS